MLWEMLLDLEMVSEFHIWYENHALKEQKILNSALKIDLNHENRHFAITNPCHI